MASEKKGGSRKCDDLCLLKLRRQMKENKSFLHKLFANHKGKGNKHLIATASYNQLTLLIHILHCIVAGKIPTKRHLLDKLSRKKVRLLSDYLHLATALEKNREDRVTSLRSLSSSFYCLLYPLFEEL